MTFAEQYSAAREKGTTEQLTLPIHSWKEEGQELIGRVIEVKQFEDSKYETPCNQYIIETDTGVVSTVMGGSVDKQLAKKAVTGKVLWIKYLGKGELDDGRKYNRFEIQEIPLA